MGPSLHLEASQTGAHQMIVARGEIDIKTAVEFEAALGSYAAETLVLDLSAVEFIDSTGLRVLTSARARMAEDGGRLVVCAPEDTAVLRTLRLAGLSADFELISGPDELDAE